MIAREELKVGETYLSRAGSRRTVKYIGVGNVVYDFEQGLKSGECADHIDLFLDDVDLLPKPKKKIKVVKYMDKYGFISESTKECFDDLVGTYKKLSEYELEVE